MVNAMTFNRNMKCLKLSGEGAIVVMKTISRRSLLALLSARRLKLDNKGGPPIVYTDEDYLFRIPLEDFIYGLEWRIDRLIELMDLSKGFVISKGRGSWDEYESLSANDSRVDRMLQLLHIKGKHSYECRGDEPWIARMLAYATVRWGRTGYGFYIVPKSNTNLVAYVPASRISLFVFTDKIQVHDSIVQTLKDMNIPAIGPHIRHPLIKSVFENIFNLKEEFTVDKNTGAVIGKGSEESACFLSFCHRLFQ